MLTLLGVAGLQGISVLPLIMNENVSFPDFYIQRRQGIKSDLSYMELRK